MAAPGAAGARPAGRRAGRTARRGLLVLALYAAVGGLFFQPTLFGGKSFSTVGAVQQAYLPWKVTTPHDLAFHPQSDQGQTFFPRQVFVDRALSAGELPAWDPYTFAGHPYLSNGGATFFYPPRLAVSLAFGAVLAHDVYLLAHMIAAGCAAFFLCRTLGRSVAASLLAGLGWMLSPYFLAWAQLELVAPVIALLPLALALVRRAHDRSSFRTLVLAGATCGAMLLGSSLDLAFAGTAVVVSYAASLELSAVWRRRRDRPRWRPVGASALRLGALGAVSVAVGSLAYIPFALLQPRIARRPFDVDLLGSAVTVPLQTFADFWRHPPLPITNDTMHLMSFSGTVIAALAVVGLFRRAPGAGLGRALAIGTIAVLGRTPAVHVWAALSSSYLYVQLGRLMFAWSLGVVLLAALGLDQVLAWVSGRTPGQRFAPIGDLARWRSEPQARARQAGALALVVLAMVLTGQQLYRFDRAANTDFIPRDAEYFYPATSGLQHLADVEAAAPGTQRVLPLNVPSTERRVVDSSIPMVFPYEQATGYDSAVPRPAAALWQVVEGKSQQEALAGLDRGLDVVARSDVARLDLLPRLAVTTIAADPALLRTPGWGDGDLAARGLTLGQRDDALALLAVASPAPRAYVVHSAESTATTATALARFTEPAFPWQTTVLLFGEQGSATPGPGAGGPLEPQRIVTRQGGTVRVEVETASPGWLVTLDSYDEGWTATLDGRPTPLVAANVAFRAVRVPAGRSVVVMTYRVPGLSAAAGITAVALVGIGVAAVEPDVRRRRAGRRQDGEVPAAGPA